MRTTTSILNEKYLTVLKNQDWSVLDCYEDGSIEIGKYSPAGEDFSICVETDNFPEAVSEYAANFDIDEHIEMWIEARRNGVSGVPSTRELVKDAEDIDEMLRELACALSKV